MISDTMKAAEPQEKLVLFFIGILLSVLALDIGSGFRQILSGILIIICNYRLIKNKNYLNAYLHLPKESRPLWIFLALLVTFSAISVSYSFATSYSIRTFLFGSLLNILLFISLSIFIIKYLTIYQTILVIKRVNLLFLIVYFFLILQWILMPHRPAFCKLQTLDGIPCQDIFFLFSYINSLFAGILHTSIYVLFFICLFLVTLISTKPTKTDIIMFAANMAVLISTTKRAGMFAVFSGFILAPLLTKCTYRYYAVMFICIALSCLFFTGAGKYFVRENWGLIVNGNIKQAWDEGGSIPLRIYTYIAYGKQVLKQPFKGVGLGRRNIKQALPDVRKQAGLGHGHNTLLNYALQIGIQGAIFLLAVILSQARILWLALKKTERNKPYHIFLTASMLFMVMFWISNTFEDAFRHESACYYWLITALITGFSMRVLSDNGYKSNG